MCRGRGVGCVKIPLLNVEEILKRYEEYLQEWPFLVAQRLIKMQVSRLKSIKTALTENLTTIRCPLLIQQPLVLTQTKETHLQQQIPRPKAEGQLETIPKVRFARVLTTPAAGAFSALTLLTRVSSV